MENPVVKTYSKLAQQYDDQKNLASCWGQAAMAATRRIEMRPTDKVVVDVGCGQGQALAELAAGAPGTRFVGVEPAEGMRECAVNTTRDCPNVEIVDGSFECLPLEDQSVDYLFSIFAFHWVTDLEGSVRELKRVLKPGGSMDLYFIGRNNGREFVRATTPIFLKHLGAKGLLDAAALRKQLTLEEARTLFAGEFGESRLEVSESHDTYYDTLEGHWGWWVRIEGQFVQIPPDRKEQCDADVKAALARLDTDQGIPYTLHELHVRLS